uniref:Uncharacterized protein n=1 Tax=Setaria digitata TaxID=48799 RepID=A0A915PP80_9BILA
MMDGKEAEEHLGESVEASSRSNARREKCCDIGVNSWAKPNCSEFGDQNCKEGISIRSKNPIVYASLSECMAAGQVCILRSLKVGESKDVLRV